MDDLWQESACSDRCRAALRRGRRIAVKAESVRGLVAVVNTSVESLWEAKATLDRHRVG